MKNKNHVYFITTNLGSKVDFFCINFHMIILCLYLYNKNVLLWNVH